MNEVLDIIGRPIHVDDFVVFYSLVYRVIGVGKPHPGGRNSGGPVRIKLAEPSKTTKSVVKFSDEMCVIPAEDVTVWLLRKGYS